MDGSREAILRAVRASAARTVADRPATTAWVRYDDLRATFAERLTDAGGALLALESDAALAATIRGLPGISGARRVLSRVEGVPSLEVGEAPRTPHDLSDHDAAVLPGDLGVAENGAVWWAPRDPMERAAAYLAEHVVIVLSANVIVHNLHEAYARIDPASSAFGCFISGPSKTADIEQALVIGAHGPRSLTVVLRSP